MEKTFIEKRIEEKAEERFNENLEKLKKDVGSNPIGEKLTLKLKGIEKPIRIGCRHYSNDNVLFDMPKNEYSNDNLKKKSNIEEIKKELIEEYIKEETNELLNKIDNLSYLFNQE